MKKTDKKLIDKTFDFTIRFNNFIIKNPEVAKKIPSNAFIVFKDTSDKKFTNANEALAKRAAKRGDTCINATLVNKNSWRLEKLLCA